MNFEFFEIDIETKESPDKVRELIQGLLLETYQISYTSDNDHFYSEIDDHFKKVDEGIEIACFDVSQTEDESWRFTLEFAYFPLNKEKYGAYPDFKLAEQIHQKFTWNCICSRQDIFNDIDEYDPYWGISLVNKKWYLCDLGGSVLMGPYTDEKNKIEGDQGIILSYELGKIGMEFRKGKYSLQQLKNESH
ncbi:hypothetical protein [Flammeovirga sp. SJP92]|uniref:hypothetical protein n=1 Tax=Flammeovirga sp. SJP92 TaxID=1775430 RepID=UPI0007881509|nr:hypothetical protein [Flammeovirga sp. SJP92]KXX66921.1 hypothetical protein AVL50_29650 [Flammeovirga sp. SJP92]